MRWNSVRRASIVIPTLIAGASLVFPCAAPGQSLEGSGAVSVGLLLRQMDGVKRVLMIGAHPDDEDTSLLTTLARGWGAETAYLSLTRGDGGQNVIGSELWEGLGVVRTGELEAARRLDGGLQFFTRAFDYGFSKSADEALSFWPRQELLADVVWIIRKFRPHVVVSVWSGTPRDGHGQHQASGIVAREAFSAAGDPARFPEQLELGVEAWAPAKLYESSRGLGGRGGGPAPGALRIQTGSLDPLLGRSLFQLSMASRSQHRSQDMGSAEPPGPRETGVLLVESTVEGGERDFFAGVDTTLAGLAGGLSGPAAGAVRGELEAYRRALRRAEERFGLDPRGVVAELGEALGRLEGVSASVSGAGGTELRLALARRSETATRAFAAAAGVVLEVQAEDDLIVPGQSVSVSALLWNGGSSRLAAPEVELRAPPGWRVTPTSVEGLASDGSASPGSLATWTFEVEVPPDADLSRLYYLREPRDGAWYRWPDDPELWGLARDPAPITGSASFVPMGTDGPIGPRLSISEEWRYVGVDPARGQFTKAVLVVPAVSVGVVPGGLVWPQSRGEERSLSVVVRTEAEGGSRGELTVRAPAGWSVTPASQPFDLPESGTQRSLTFAIRPTGAPAVGTHVLSFSARDEGGRSYSEGDALVDYEHIERAALFAPAEARVTVVPVAVAQGLRVGYIMGSGDDGPEAIRQLGAEVELLGESEVRAGAFDAFGTIVLGVRAYETRPDLRAASGQLLDFVRGGGVVVAQYNRGPLGSLAPLPLEVGRSAPRVADETARVRVLDASAPPFTTPNRIGAGDFEGWVQERGLYFGAEWDEGYTPLLELNDPGEPPARGSLLVASEGEGVFVYAALSFFRQWADGVPGAYRLFANLISLDPAEWRAYAASR